MRNVAEARRQRDINDSQVCTGRVGQHREGPLQAVLVDGLAKYASHDRILAAALGISVLALLCRLPLGLGAAGTFARRVLAIEASEHPKGEQGKDLAEAPRAAN